MKSAIICAAFAALLCGCEIEQPVEKPSGIPFVYMYCAKGHVFAVKGDGITQVFENGNYGLRAMECDEATWGKSDD